MRTRAFASLVSLSLVMAALNADAATVAGRSVAATSGAASGTTLSGGPFFFSVSLDKARRKTMLLIDGTVSSASNSEATSLSIDIQLEDENAIVAVPAEGGTIQTRCEANQPCALSGHWWVDVDAIEAANPGLFANKPILVTLRGAHTPAVGVVGATWYALRAQLVKK